MPGFDRKLVLVSVVLTLAITVGAASLGRALIRTDDLLEPCDVVVVLNGSHPDRANEAVSLHRSGVGREIWLTTDPGSAGPDGRDAGTASNQRVLGGAGVAEDRIRLIPGRATSTRAEVELIAAELRRRGFDCAVLVTSASHGPRVRVTWSRTIGGTPRAIVRTVDDRRADGMVRTWAEPLLTLAALLGVSR